MEPVFEHFRILTFGDFNLSLILILIGPVYRDKYISKLHVLSTIYFHIRQSLATRYDYRTKQNKSAQIPVLKK
jgi:hypothetical protein